MTPHTSYLGMLGLATFASRHLSLFLDLGRSDSNTTGPIVLSQSMRTTQGRTKPLQGAATLLAYLSCSPRLSEQPKEVGYTAAAGNKITLGPNQRIVITHHTEADRPPYPNFPLVRVRDTSEISHCAGVAAASMYPQVHWSSRAGTRASVARPAAASSDSRA